MPEYRRGPVYRMSSPMIWQSLLYTTIDRTKDALDKILREHWLNGEPITITIEFDPEGSLVVDFDEDKQTSEMVKALAKKRE